MSSTAVMMSLTRSCSSIGLDKSMMNRGAKSYTREKQAENHYDCVIACGGGAVLREENRIALRRNGVIVWLQRDPAKLPTDAKPVLELRTPDHGAFVKGVTLGKAGWLIAAFEIAGILGMIVAGWATDRLAGGRGPRVCVFFLLGAAVFMTLFAALPVAAPTWILVSALVGAGFCVYGPYAVTGVTATNLATKSLAGTAVGFIGIFAYASVIFSGVVMGAFAERFGGWNVPFDAMIGVAFLGAGLFALLWRSKATGYEPK